MAGNAMGALTVKVVGADYKLWLGMSVLADVQEQFPEHFDQLMAGTLAAPPLKMIVALVAGALERWHPEQAKDRYFVDELLNENEHVFVALLGASGPKAGTHPGKGKARPK